MSYVVTSGHVECLESGRMVAPGSDVSNTEARQNPRLIERGLLREKAKPRPKAQSKPAVKPETTAPESEQSKEDDK